MEARSDYIDGAAAAWMRAFPGEDLGAYEVIFRIIRAGRIAESMLDQIAKQNGLGVRGDYDVLASLRRAHPKPLRPQDLADRVMISAPGITGRLDRLEAAGLIARKAHPTDRRATLISITAKGRRVADRAFASILQAINEMVEDVPPSVRADLAAALREMMVALGDTPRSTPL
jgi:DNA-binding MarR family transcriptional regulator